MQLAYSVLDDKTGDLLEYCHLMKHPKYKDVWTKSFSTEIQPLATMWKPRKMRYHKNAKATKRMHK
jgi:hypothetical protein